MSEHTFVIIYQNPGLQMCNCHRGKLYFVPKLKEFQCSSLIIVIRLGSWIFDSELKRKYDKINHFNALKCQMSKQS